MKIRNTLLLAGSLLLLGACDESKYDLDSLVPEQTGSDLVRYG